jgi:hypothetical protein
MINHRYLTKVGTATARLPYSLVNACGLSSPEGYAEAECDGGAEKVHSAELGEKLCCE